MNIEIITETLELDCYGFSAVVVNGDYAGKLFQLMDRMWQTVKANQLANEGKNIWIYEDGNKVFAGVVLNNIPNPGLFLERKKLGCTKYAHYKHIGPYHLIKQAGQAMRNEIQQKGFENILPYIEIYGHWSNDESKLETELVMCLR